MVRTLYCCRGRTRTSTERLALTQMSFPYINLIVVNPLCYVYPLLSTPETGGYVCQFHHSTLCQNKKLSFQSLFALCYDKGNKTIINIKLFYIKYYFFTYTSLFSAIYCDFNNFGILI